MSTARTDDRPLVVRRSRRRQLPVLLQLTGYLAAYALAGLTGFIPKWIVVLGIVMFTPAVLVALIHLARSSSGSTALLRIGPTGLEVPEVGAVAWADLDDVVVRPTRWGPRYSVVVFVPRPGVTPPSIPRSRQSIGGWRSSRKGITARYGSPLVLQTAFTTATTQDVLDAVHHHQWFVQPPD